MRRAGIHRLFFVSGLMALLLWCGGCDAFYRMLQKEGAEERDIIGEVSPLERNERVAEVQKLLKTYGYRVGQVDGILGASTRDAIEQFQKDNRLTPSRFVDKKTWDYLIRLEQYGLIYNGDIVLKAVQQALKEAGFHPGPLDGQPGQMTKVAIIEFQKKNKLKADGKIGYKTLRRLAVYLPPYLEETSEDEEIKKPPLPPPRKSKSLKKSK